MIPILTYLMDSGILDVLNDDSETDDLVLFESDEEEEDDDTEEDLEIVEYDSDESIQGEEERTRVEASDSEDSDGDDDAPTAPKQRCIQNTPQANNGAGTSSDAPSDESRPSTSRQHVDLRHSVQLQLAPQPTLYQQDEQLEPQPIRIQARSFLESSSSLGVLSSAQILEQGIVVVPPLQQLISADIMQLVSNQSTIGGGESNHRSHNGRIHYLHLYPREE